VLKFTSFPRAARLALVERIGINVAALFACVALAAHVSTARAQTPQRREGAPVVASPAPSPSTAAAATAATDDHDLSITANVTARELRFEVVPNPKVEFPGQPRRDTVWEAERTNLPLQVQPGVTYRDIGIRLKITSVFADIERIVAEALGEISASDDSDTPRTTEPYARLEPGTNALPPQIGRARPAKMNAAQMNAAQMNAAPHVTSTAITSTQTTHASSAPRAPSVQTTPPHASSNRARARRERR
jgi:hypothetical protein